MRADIHRSLSDKERAELRQSHIDDRSCEIVDELRDMIQKRFGYEPVPSESLEDLGEAIARIETERDEAVEELDRVDA